MIDRPNYPIPRIALFLFTWIGASATTSTALGLTSLPAPHQAGFSAVERIPIDSVPSWHDWDASTLAGVTVVGGSAWFTDHVVFDEPYSLVFDYEPGAWISFPFQSPSLYTGGLFFAAFFDPARAQVGDTIVVEFLDGGLVRESITLTPSRRYWNRCEVYSEQSQDELEPRVPSDMALTGYLPPRPDAIRIRPPQNRSGVLYVGKLFLGTNARVDALELEPDRVVPPIDVLTPDPPGYVTSGQLADLTTVRERLDEIYGVAPYTQVPSIDVAAMDDLRQRYDVYGIDRRGPGNLWLGTNPMMYENDPDWFPAEAVYGELMLDLARSFRNTADMQQQAELEGMFLDLLDYSECLGGAPDRWTGGFAHLPSIYLMRDLLRATGRLRRELLASYKERIGFSRVYLDHSYFATTGITGWSPEQPSRVYREGETGEDVDYLRIISIQNLLHAVLAETPEESVRDLSYASRWFSDFAFQYGPGTADGYRPDGHAYHHWGWVRQYEEDCFTQSARIVYTLSGTEFRLSEAAHGIVRNALVGQDWRSLYGITPNHLSGKGGHPYQYGGNSQTDADRYAYLALSGTPDGNQPVDGEMAGVCLRGHAEYALGNTTATPFLERAVTDLLAAGHDPAPPRSGTRVFNYGNVVVHRKDSWLASLKGHGKFQYVRESSDPWITYFGYGMLDVVDDYWIRYGSVKLGTDLGLDGYDWRKYPGTTTINFADIQSIVNQEYKRYWSDETFVGGVTQGAHGAFALRLKGSTANGLGSYVARKSWFFFDGTVLALGSGITNTVPGEETITTLYQDAIDAGSTTWFDSPTPITGLDQDVTTKLAASAWLVDSEGIGYWVPAGQTITVKRRAQTNPDWRNTEDTSGEYALAWIGHGAAPTDASYVYALRPGSSPRDMEAFDAEMDGSTPPFEVLAHNEAVHAVLSHDYRTYGVLVFDSAPEVDVRDVVRVSNPCTILVEESASDRRRVSVVDPNLDLLDHTLLSHNESWGVSQPRRLVLVLRGSWRCNGEPEGMLAVDSEVGSGTTTVLLRLVEGRTVELNLVRN